MVVFTLLKAMCICQDRLGYAAVTNQPLNFSGLKQHIFISHSSQGWGVQDGGAGRFST